MRIIGVNSGTSMDGLDCALVSVGEQGQKREVRCLATRHFAFPKSLHDALIRLTSQERVDKEEVARTDLSLGRFIGRAIRKFMDAPAQRRVHLIASHGQTIGHWTQTGPPHATYQIGSLNAIAQTAGVDTVGSFRVADIAAGGMGAPLSGYYHHLIFGPEHVVLNIGGIANLSASRYRAGVLEVRAFDVGPGNMFSDGLAQRLLHRPYDRNGGVAARGNVLKAITRAALARAYFERRPPKTCGREEFGATAMERLFFRSGRPRGSTADLLATAVEITAQSIARACERWLSRFTESRALVVTGGGAHNQALMRRLQELLPAWQLISPREWGIPDDFVEPVGFAVLGYEFACGRPGNLGGATGARPAILGLRALADG